MCLEQATEDHRSMAMEEAWRVVDSHRAATMERAAVVSYLHKRRAGMSADQRRFLEGIILAIGGGAHLP